MTIEVYNWVDGVSSIPERFESQRFEGVRRSINDRVRHTLSSEDAIREAFQEHAFPWQNWKKKKKLANGFWRGETGKVRAEICLVVAFLGAEFEDPHAIQQALKPSWIKKQKLYSAMYLHFRNSCSEVLQDLFPDVFEPWQLNRVPNGYWSGPDAPERIKGALKWFVDHILHISEDCLRDIPNLVSAKAFANAGLGGLLEGSFANSPREAIEFLYPGMFRDWQFNKVPNGYWNGEEGERHVDEALEWFFFDYCGFKKEKRVEVLPEASSFSDAGLGGVLSNVFSGNIAKAALRAGVEINEKLKEETTRIKRRWTKKSAAAYLKAELEGKSHDEIRKLPAGYFRSEGRAYPSRVLGGDIPSIIEHLFPGEFKPWEFRKVENGYWNGAEGPEHRREAIEWLLQECRFDNASDEEIKNGLTRSHFEEHGLIGMLNNCYGLSPYRALTAYAPDRFPDGECTRLKGYWNREKAIKSFRQKLESHERNDRPHILNHQQVADWGMSYPYKKFFQSSRILLLKTVFPKEGYTIHDLYQFEVSDWKKMESFERLEELLKKHQITRTELKKLTTNKALKEAGLYTDIRRIWGGVRAFLEVMKTAEDIADGLLRKPEGEDIQSWKNHLLGIYKHSLADKERIRNLLTELYEGLVYGVLAKEFNGGHPSVRDQLISNGFMGLLEGFENIDMEKCHQKPNGYLYMRIKWAMLRVFRERDRYAKHEISLHHSIGEDGELVDLLKDDSFQDPSISVQNQSLHQGRVKKIKTILQKFPERTRYAICSYYGLEGNEVMSMKRIGKELGVTTQSVSMMLKKARNHIATHYPDLAQLIDE